MKQQDSDANDHRITGMTTPKEYKRFLCKSVFCHQEESVILKDWIGLIQVPKSICLIWSEIS